PWTGPALCAHGANISAFLKLTSPTAWASASLRIHRWKPVMTGCARTPATASRLLWASPLTNSTFRRRAIAGLVFSFRVQAAFEMLRWTREGSGKKGLRSMDAIHLALASTAEADFFCTCDDKLFQKV